MDQNEYKIWQTAKAQGRDDAFIKGAIQAYRMSKNAPVQKPTLTQKNQDVVHSTDAAVRTDIAGTNSQSQGEGGFLRGLLAVKDAFKGAVAIGGNIVNKLAGDKTNFSGNTAPIQFNKPEVTVAGTTKGIADSIGFKPEPTQGFTDAVNIWSQNHPDAAKNLDSILKGLGATGEIAGTIAAADIGIGGAEKTGAEVANSLRETGSISKDIIAPTATAKDLLKVNEMITPNPTVAQARLAESQGRLYEGKKPTLFKAGTADRIATPEKQMQATRTIVDTIPNASKMSPGELYTAVDEKIGSTAESLRPQMQATPLQQETVIKLNEDWGKVKTQQLADAPATEEPNVLKRQTKFETFLQKSDSNNLNDLWDTRIAYDNSIPVNVKKANQLSSESLQLQKQEWLQNRAILNNAINDNVAGLGETSQKAFADMSNLYEAKTNLLSKAKVESAKMSKVNQFLKNNPKVASALGGVTVYEILKHLGIPLP